MFFMWYQGGIPGIPKSSLILGIQIPLDFHMPRNYIEAMLFIWWPKESQQPYGSQCSPMEENCPSCYVHIWPQVPTSCPVLGRFGVQHNVGKFRCGPASLACPGSNASPSRGTKVCNASGCFRCPCPLCAIAGHLWWCTTSMTWTRAPYCLWGVQKEILHCPW